MVNIADKQKTTWNVGGDRLASGHGIDPKVALLKARSGTLGEAGSRPNKEPGQTANRIAEFGSAKLAVERASDLRRINGNDSHGERQAPPRQDRG